MADKILEVIFFRRIWLTSDWQYADPESALHELLAEMTVELKNFGIQLRSVEEKLPVNIQGYGDLLNSIRLCSPVAGVASLCLGHIIGASPNLDIVADLRRGINRVAFAPETVEPQGSDRVVCHNCGCGC